MAMERDKALAVARQFVLELYPPADDRSHPRTVTEMREMLSQILTIAEYLSATEAVMDDGTLQEILKVAKSIHDDMP